MLSRGSVAIDLGTVNTLVWVDGRGLVLEEPSAIAIDDAPGRSRPSAPRPTCSRTRSRKDIRVIHPLRDGVIADLDATAEMLHGFLRKSGALSGPFGGARWCACRAAPPGWSGGRWSPRSAPGGPGASVELVDEPVAAAAGAGFDLSAGDGGFVVDVGGGTTEVAAVAGWRVVRAESLRMAGNAMDEAIVNAAQVEPRHDPQPAGGAAAQDRARPHRRARTAGRRRSASTPRAGRRASRRCPATWWRRRSSRSCPPSAPRCRTCSPTSPRASPRTWCAARSGCPAAARCCPASPDRLGEVAGIGVIVAEDPLRCVVRGAAAMLAASA